MTYRRYTHIKYLDLLPGAGKTQYVIEELTRIIRKKETYGIYVSPTLRLLEEVKERLEKRAKKKNNPEYVTNVHLFSGRRSASVLQDIRYALAGGLDKDGSPRHKLPYGSILLITHEAFLRMPYFPEGSKINLFFDEARKCIIQRNSVKFTSPEVILALPKILEQQPFEDSRYMEARLKEGDTVQKVWERIKKLVPSASLTASRDRLSLHRLLDVAANPRVTLFLRPDKLNSNSIDKYTVIEVLLPDRVFSGFNSVLLLSAFFEDSQMYHLLRNQDNVILNPLTTDSGNKLGDLRFKRGLRFIKRETLLKDRYRKATIVPLTVETRSLSKSLMNGVLVEEKTYPKVVEILATNNINTPGSFMRIKKHMRDPSLVGIPEHESNAVKQLSSLGNKFVVNPFTWYLDSAESVLNTHGKKLVGSTNKPLLVTNTGEYAYEAQHRFESQGWECITTSVHGINEYKDSNVVIFLAAINPTPELLRFYNRYLPNYEAEKDHVADAAIQCVCRCALRDPGSDSRVLVIVPDMRIATLLFEKMQNRPRITEKYSPKPTMHSLTKNVNVAKKDARPPRIIVAKSNAAHQKQYRNATPFNADISRVRNAVSYYKRKMKEYEHQKDESKAYFAKDSMEMYQKELQELLIKRDNWKKENL